MPVYADFSNRYGEPFMTDSPRGREWERAQRSVNAEIDDHVRADGVTGGLKMITTKDHADRPIYTFQLAPGASKRTTWMAPHCSEPHLQIRINNASRTLLENQAFEAEWRTRQIAIANGTYRQEF